MISNPLVEYFDGITSGPGIWKWHHYLDVYHRHFQRFVGQSPVVVEVGVYSGGSLRMWQKYFGPRCEIHGIDIRGECRVYADSQTSIHIGDQADPVFWRRFREEVPHVDILIDDGGHLFEQQRTTLDAMLPHLRPGGVYLCEDVHGVDNPFFTHVQSLMNKLNCLDLSPVNECSASRLTPFQKSVSSIHLYPFVIVIETRSQDCEHLYAPKRGDEWQAFY